MPAQKSNAKLSTAPVTKATLLPRCKARGFTITQLAADLGCSREAIYFAVEMPSRYKPLYFRIQKALQ